jgi:hypothetical protein
VGRIGTRFVVGVVAVVLAVAIADSLRSGAEDEEPPQPAPTRPPEPGVESRIAIADRLRHEGIQGRLLYTDERCNLRAVSLPDLEPAATPGVRGLSCGFSASPDGQRVAPPGAAWSPDSRRLALCRGSAVVVSVATERAPETERHEGCKPAWRPDGLLTFVRNGEVVEAGGRRVVARAAIEAAARSHPITPDASDTHIAYEVADLAWPTATRVAVLITITFSAGGRTLGPETQVALFEGGRVVGVQSGLGQKGTRLDASRRFLAVRPGGLLDPSGRRLYPVAEVGTGGGDAVAVSPDGRWVAIGLQDRVTLLSIPSLRAGRFRSVSLPFAARDLAWR